MLAAGAGRRFGSPKQLADLDGVPLLQHAIDAMLAVPALDGVVVVLGAAAEHVAAAVKFADAEPVVCEDWEEGMAASLRCGVARGRRRRLGRGHARRQPGDHARGDRGGHRRDRRPAADAVRAEYGGRPGHPVALSRALFGRVADLRGDVGARELLASVAVRDVEARHLARPDDVDTPEELEAIRA